jgi:integrase/recombinase XerD
LSKKRTDIAIRTEEIQLNHMLSVIPSDWKMTAITENDIAVVLNKISKRETARGFISCATVNRYRSRLLAIFNHAVREGLLIKNPVKSYRKAKELPRKRVLSDNEFQSFLRVCKASRNSELCDIMVIAYYTGMRLGEVKGLLISNIDIEQNMILLGEWQTKAERARFIPIHPLIKGILKKRIQSALENGREKLFISRSIRTAAEKAIKRAGLKNFTFRDLRRTFATRLKDTNANVHIISKLLGHSSITMTEKYLGISLKALEEAVLRL